MVFGMRKSLFVTLWLVASVIADEYKGGTPHTTVVTLDAESFPEAMKDLANPFWLLKFYAPWCGHCKKLAPILDKVAPQLEGKMAIGKIDCTQHKGLCNEYKVRGYPTMKYARDGEIYDYPGGREEKSILAFASKMSSPVIRVVKTYDEALEFAKTETEEGVAFMGYDPKSTEENPTELFQIYQQVARKQQAAHHFLWLQNPEERDYAFVHRVEHGFQPKGWVFDKEMTTESLMKFVKEQSVPTLTTFGPQNFHRFGSNGRPLVVSVVNDMDEEELVNAIKEHMLAYIKTTDEEIINKYYFGLMDGKKWGKFLEQFSVTEGENPQTIILDVPNKTYWQNATYKNMFEFMKAKEAGEIPSEVAVQSGRKGILAKVEHAFIVNLPWSLLLMLALIVGIVFLLVPSSDDLRPPYDRDHTDAMEFDGDDDDEPTEGEKDAENEEPKKEK